MIDTEQELRAAQRFASDPRWAAAFDFPADISGLGFVEFFGNTYQPAARGEAAVIVAVEAGGELIDLVACRISDRATATRLGVAGILGADAVEASRLRGHPLLIYRDPLHWLQAGCLGVAILDWWSLPWALAGVAEIKCATAALEEQVRQALAVPTDFPAFIPARRAA